VAVAFADGGIVLIDDLDGLDGQHKPIVLGLLIQLKMGSIFVAGSWGNPEPDLSGITEFLGEDMRVVWMG
jgi:hypothetical protein